MINYQPQLVSRISSINSINLWNVPVWSIVHHRKKPWKTPAIPKSGTDFFFTNFLNAWVRHWRCCLFCTSKKVFVVTRGHTRFQSQRITIWEIHFLTGMQLEITVKTCKNPTFPNFRTARWIFKGWDFSTRSLTASAASFSERRVASSGYSSRNHQPFFNGLFWFWW